MKANLIHYFQSGKILLLCFGILMCFALFSSCQSDKAKYSYTNDELATIIADLHIAENLANSGVGKQKDSLAKQFYSEVFQIHKLDSMEIEQNIELLKNDPKKMAVVYELVLEVLKKKEAQDK